MFRYFRINHTFNISLSKVPLFTVRNFISDVNINSNSVAGNMTNE